MSDLFATRDYYKPFTYPWAYKAYKLMRALSWEPHEAPMDKDILDWNTKLNPKEKGLLTQLFRFFTQADIDIASGYFDKYAPRFKLPELRMMIGQFIAAEANHIDAYSTLIETLGLPEVEYKAFQEYQAMREKHEYMFARESGKGIADLMVDIAVFSAFGEGMQLFSSFALLMSFQRRGLMKGMTTIVEWSIRDESLHVESMIKLLHELIKEHPRAWNDETKKRVYDACRAMVTLEDAFIDQCTNLGEVEGFTAAEAKEYIRYIADRRLLQLGLKPNYGVKANPFDWLDWIMNAPTHTNFFEQRSTEYGKGETPGWPNAFDFLKRGPLLIEGGAGKIAKMLAAEVVEGCSDDGVCAVPEAVIHPIETVVPLPHGGSVTIDMQIEPEFRVYTKPGCPHCDDAKALLKAKGLVFEAIELPEAEQRQAKFAEIHSKWGATWKSSPMIFTLNGTTEVEFIGGASDLRTYLKD
ncbi:putative ribonucleoside diphosphate reductase beta subunit [Caulobacter phage CcrColossus]|uniref:ribonucleoside-diphosphate reductase n=1 Tax=Caulobacter phage CcrColossus TaxID=1211640 RepID=K4K678_9CAUD|nr:putative ribonucleoside diphosphate reductase beta subunit [Caulobacter phage CcrColossus]AFU88012.1 putative ribonucleoside diphosphate reductase beta subunit [Caulobacter phage CcrColossus]